MKALKKKKSQKYITGRYDLIGLKKNPNDPLGLLYKEKNVYRVTSRALEMDWDLSQGIAVSLNVSLS